MFSKESNHTQTKSIESSLRENVRNVMARIEASAMRAGRDPGQVRLLAATKNRSVAQIEASIAAGVRLIGENKVQEFAGKASAIEGAVEIHFIGHLQRNKVRQVVGMVELIHSLDSVRLAREINDISAKKGIVQKALIQVNVAEEESKSGIAPRELEWFLKEIKDLRNLDVRGLSTIAPYARRGEEVRWVFKRLRELSSGFETERTGFRLKELSMGMTNDFEIAVEEGSTIVRIGAAIFGLGPRVDGEPDKEVV
ncbi:MAG: YggS family pyridoxal phosphate-dependent enzyme [Candidatus Anoxymicrobium japonicum]|uniref:Pyridoxal phosphate homeostasis protein n=1 Tax=Candidatus Anoxymicrobium japonicum TaxID=2013648 RepID=A0A2N3G7N2_9ACTN|nr:MAG: YggS family pyridoxal phosphate-dependent enzyme [Candidatus Anoxymicrobium japonicum]